MGEPGRRLAKAEDRTDEDLRMRPMVAAG